MYKKITVALFLLFLAGPSYGHQALLVHDADGDRIGELIDDFDSQDMVLLTSDGYLMWINFPLGNSAV